MNQVSKRSLCSSPWHSLLCLLLLSSLVSVFTQGCAPIERSQEYGDIALQTQGTKIEEVQLNEGVLKVERADLAFGPLYLCSGVQAGNLCDTARLEFLDSKVIHLLDDNESSLGRLNGMSGMVQSWMYDLGIVSTLTHSRPVILNAARDLGGYSFVLEGTLRIQNRDISLKIEVALSQFDATEKGVSLVRKSQSESFRYTITKEDVLGQTQRVMMIRFPFQDWLESLNFSRDLTDAKLDELCPSADECSPWLVSEESEVMRQVKTTLVTQMRPQFNYE